MKYDEDSLYAPLVASFISVAAILIPLLILALTSEPIEVTATIINKTKSSSRFGGKILIVDYVLYFDNGDYTHVDSNIWENVSIGDSYMYVKWVPK